MEQTSIIAWFLHYLKFSFRNLEFEVIDYALTIRSLSYRIRNPQLNFE